MSKIVTWLVFAGCFAVGVGGIVTSCTVEARREVAQHVIDCTKQDSTALVNLIVAMSLPIFNGQLPDWTVIENMAIVAGRDVGGCALAMVVDDWVHKHPAMSSIAESTSASEALERFRREHGGGAIFRTGHGDL